MPGSKAQLAARLARLNSDDPLVRARALRAQAGGIALRERRLSENPAYFRTLGQNGGRKAGEDSDQQAQNGRLGYEATVELLGRERVREMLADYFDGKRARKPATDRAAIMRAGRRELAEQATTALSNSDATYRALRQQAQELIEEGDTRLKELRAAQEQMEQMHLRLFDDYPNELEVWG